MTDQPQRAWNSPNSHQFQRVEEGAPALPVHPPQKIQLLTLAVLLIAFAARLYTLGDPAFWYDEGLVGWSARLAFLETARWTAADVHPPLYFWAVTAWRWLAGESEFALRLLSASFGLLCAT